MSKVIGLIVIGLIVIALMVVCCLPAGNASAGEELNLSLEEAVRIAFERNLGLEISRLDVKAAEGDVQAASGVFDTFVSASLGGGESRSESTTELQGTGIVAEDAVGWNLGLSRVFETGTRFDAAWENRRFGTNVPFATLDPGYATALSLSLTQPLLKGRGRDIQTAGIRSAERVLASQSLALDDQAVLLGADVRKAYWELVYAREEMEVLKLSLKLAETLHEETREKIEVGVLAPVEIHLPAAEVAKREQQLIVGENLIGASEDALKLLLNAPSWEVAIIPISVPETAGTLPDLDGVLGRALSARSDIRAANEQLEAARISRTVAANNLLPDLSLTGGITANGLDDGYGGAIDDLDRSGVYSWQVGLSLAVPLENRAARGELLKAQAREEQAQAAFDLLTLEVTKDVQEAVRSVRLAFKAIEAARKTSLASKKGLEAEKAKFEVGLSTTNDVLTVQESYARALSGEQRAVVTYQQALADLDRTQGILPGGEGLAAP